jgi:glycolate oxidase FAD binding subunit
MKPLTPLLIDQLAKLLGSDSVLLQDGLADYAVDGLVPSAVVRPEDRSAVAETLRWAASQGVAVIPRGGGTQLALGNIPKRIDLVLDLSRLNRVLDYQPADLTATVEAGIPLEALQRELATGGKFVSLEAPLADRATIGGILAANAGGPLRHAYGSARDWLIGIGVAGADGRETKAGGRVVKNVTGYDLNKLYTGSLGTLGVITEATFKLAPLAENRAALVATFGTVQEGIEGAWPLLRQVYAPLGVQVLTEPVAQRLNVPMPAPGHQALAVAFFAGRPRALRRRLEDSAGHWRNAGAEAVERLDDADATLLLRELTDLGWSAESHPYLSLRVNLPPSRVGQVAGWLQGEESFGWGAPPNGLAAGSRDPGMVIDPGFGNIRLFCWYEVPPVGSIGTDKIGKVDENVVAAIERLREMVREIGGSVVVEQCPLSVKRRLDVWGQDPSGMEIMRRVKNNLDPQGILNPGRFLGGI